MNTKNLGSMLSAIALSVSLAGLIVAARAQATGGQAAAPAAAGQTATAAVVTAGQSPQFKNIQVLKDIPADQLIPTMQFIANSLGKDCDFCHVGQTNGQNNFDKDDKQPKKTARHMIQMQMAINKDNFNGNNNVTCYSCHRGSNDPVNVPAVIQTDAPPANEAAAAAQPANPPSVDQIVDKWIAASGGADAINKVSSRVATGKILFGGGSQAVEIYAKAPNKRISIVHSPRGDSPTAFDGQVGWLGGGNNVHDMTAQESAGARMDAVLHLPTEIKQTLTRLRVVRPDKIDGKDVYTLVGTATEGLTVRLYFDEQSGQLVRMVRYTPTPLGRNPVQVDYSDYRDVNGVKVAYKWVLSRPLGRFTIQLDDVKQNVAVDDSKFTKPAAAAAPGGEF